MIPIFVISNREYIGKTFVVIGLILKLSDKGFTVGYLKPFGKSPVKQGGQVFDADAVFLKETLSLPDPLDVISPFVLSPETHELLVEGMLGDTKNRVLETVLSQGDKDFLIVGGAGDIFEGSSLGVDALSLIRDLRAHVLLVESWRGESSMDTFFGVRGLVGERFLGGVINKVPAHATAYVRDTVKPFLEARGIELFGVFQKDSLLEAVTVRQLNMILNGRVLCCEDNLDQVVEHFSVGAMDVDSAISYFRRTPNKAVITGAHRTEIQLAAMETSTACVILTGGLYVSDVIVGKAQLTGIPIISVTDDTFTTIDRIEAAIGKIGIREERKVSRAREIMEQFDYARFLKKLKQ